MLNDHTVTVPTLTPAEVAAIKEAAKRAQDGNRRVRVQAMAGVAASLTPELVIALCEAYEALRELARANDHPFNDTAHEIAIKRARALTGE